MAMQNKHGGSRAGAGRPKGQGRYSELTKPVRVPVSRVDDVKRYLTQSEAKSIIEQHSAVRFPAKNPATITLSLFSSKVAAGFASPADNHVETSIDLNQHLIRHPSDTFFVKVEGYSMLGAGIHEGDTLIVDCALEVQTGKVVIAVVNGELTVKRLHIGKDKSITLLAENPDYPHISITEALDFVILGVVTNVIHEL